MIGLNELYDLIGENQQKIADLQAENRVLNKLVDLEKSRAETACEETQEIIEENQEQEIY